MASIKKVMGKKGVSYRITVSNGYDISGKKRRVTATFHPKPNQAPKDEERALDAFVLEFERRVKTGCAIEGDKITLDEFINRWLEEYAVNQLEAATISSYANYIKNHIIPKLGSYKLAEIKPIHLQGYYSSLMKDGARPNGKSGGYSAATVRKHHAILSSIFSSAYKWQLIDSNPCDRAKPPRRDKEAKIRSFDLEQTETFLNMLEKSRDVSYQMKLFYYMAVYGGFRRGELAALTWEKVDFKNSVIIVDRAAGGSGATSYNKAPKTRSSVRNVAMPPVVMAMLRTHRMERAVQGLCKREDYIFTQADGRQIHVSSPSHTFRKMIDRFNSALPPDKQLPQIGLHGLRHTHATLLIFAGTDVKTVSARLGHSQTSTTLNIYAHSLRKADEVCANTMYNLLNVTNT